MTDNPSNNKTSSSRNKKYLHNTQLNFKNDSKSNYTLKCSFDQENKSNFYTKEFDRMLHKNHLPSRKNIEKNNGKICSFDHNLTEKGIIKFPAEKLFRNETEDNQQNSENSVSEIYKLSHFKVEKSSTITNQTENQPGEILDKLNVLRQYENSEIIDVVEERSEYRTDLGEEYAIFKSCSSSTAIATTDMFNTQKLESGDENVIKELKNIKNSKLENLKISQEKNNRDLKLVIKEKPNAVPPALNKKYLYTGITRKEILECLKNKKTSGAVSELKKDIALFSNDAANAGDIKSRNRRFHINAADHVSKRNSQKALKRKSVEGNNDSKKYDNVIMGNKRHKHKFLRGNNILDNRYCISANIVKKSRGWDDDDDDDDDTIEKSPKTGFGIGSLSSNHEAKNYDEERGLESKKNTKNVQMNSENSDAIEMLPLKNDVQSVAEKAWQDLTNIPLEVKRRSKEEQDHENDLAKITIHNMVNTAKSRSKKNQINRTS